MKMVLHHEMPRRHGYSPRGRRCFGQPDWGAKGRTNVRGALLAGLLLTVTLLMGKVNSDVFFAWITPEFLPKLPSKGVIVMDKASFHQRLDIQNAIRQAGHLLLLLPPYLPQLNPIEPKWAQAKAIRKPQPCSISDIFTR
jgi:transposase